MRLGRVVVFAVFGLAALASWFVVRQFPREGQGRAAGSPQARPAIAPQRVTPPVATPGSPTDGTLDVRATAGGEPLPGADVRAYLELVLPGARAPEWRVAGRAETGADGVAHVPAAPGAYLVAVRARGLAPAHVEAIRAPGELAANVDVALEPASRLSGRVVDAVGGAPLRARVAAIPLASAGAAFAPAAAPPEEVIVVEADDDGAFRLDGVAPGAWAISVEAPDRNPALVPRVPIPRDGPLVVRLEPLAAVEGIVLAADGRPAAGAVVRLAGREHDAAATTRGDGTFSVRAPGGSYRMLASRDGLAAALPEELAIAAGSAAKGVTLRLAPASAIEGTIDDAAGKPIAAATVVACPHETAAEIGRATAGLDGRFRIAGLAPGSYDVKIAARGLSPAFLGGVAVDASTPFRARVALAGTGAVEGVVRNPAGTAVAGARVRIVSRGDGLAAAAPFEARADFEGRWRIDGLEAGRAELVAHQEGVAIGVSRAVRVEPGRAARADFFLPEGGILAGRVAMNGLRPPAGTAVVAVPMRGGLGEPQVARAAVDASGNYRLALPAGEYRVHAAPGDALRTDLRVAPAFARVVAARTTRLDLSVSPLAEESGTTVAIVEPGGAPSPGAVVTVSRATDERIALATTAGEDGRLVLAKEMGLAGQPITIRARSGGRTGSWTGNASAEGTVVVRLSPGAAVKGVVRGSGAPVSGFTLEVASEPVEGGWRTLDQHRFSGDRFELGDLPPEPLRLTVRTADGRRGAASTSAVAGRITVVDIALEASASRAGAR